VQQRLGQETSWVVKSPIEDGDFFVRDLTAGLSFWIYSFTCGSNLLNSLSNHDELKTAGVAKFDTFKIVPREPSTFLQIIGSSRSTDVDKIEKWIGKGKCAMIGAYAARKMSSKAMNQHQAGETGQYSVYIIPPLLSKGFLCQVSI
jgi:hypothetical protein